jgi:hypothetical protein
MDRRFVNRRGVRTPIGALKCLIYFEPMGSIFCAEQDFDSVAAERLLPEPNRPTGKARELR